MSFDRIDDRISDRIEIEKKKETNKEKYSRWKRKERYSALARMNIPIEV